MANVTDNPVANDAAANFSSMVDEMVAAQQAVAPLVNLGVKVASVPDNSIGTLDGFAEVDGRIADFKVADRFRQEEQKSELEKAAYLKQEEQQFAPEQGGATPVNSMDKMLQGVDLSGYRKKISLADDTAPALTNNEESTKFQQEKKAKAAEQDGPG